MNNTPKLTIFEYRFNNEELENEFNDFFYKYNLTSLFTNEHRAGNISVNYIDAKSVLNTGGKYRKDLLELADIINMAQDNKSYEEAMFRIIYEARSMQGLMSNVRKIVQYIHNIDFSKRHNTWNIVWYNKDLK